MKREVEMIDGKGGWVRAFKKQMYHIVLMK
jgi:hypothetical protein